MAKSIMIQGTMSNVGKSILTAGLCRIFRQDGFRAVPFKSQNMALNSYITRDGLEMGRAQVMQAEAAGITPLVSMNPILLKPVNNMGSQVIVNGEVRGNMTAREYFSYRKKLVPEILRAYHSLEEQADIIVIEGAGSPAEINLKQNDIVNMGLAKLVDAPVLLAGDIDRGGVFAQLAGTLLLLEEEERKRIKGLVINKFRGDKTLLDSGIRMLAEKTGLPVLGTVPYMDLSIEEEDSLTERFERTREDQIDIAVIRFPRISNFTDFTVFEQIEGVSLRYIDSPGKLGQPDLIFLPGSKNTISDLKWMRQNGLEASIKKHKNRCVIFGICGGYQMLGEKIQDPYGVEEGGEICGMELLPLETVLGKQKIRSQVQGAFGKVKGILASLSYEKIVGYQIHMGQSRIEEDADALCFLLDVHGKPEREDGTMAGSIYGTYVHGIFDHGAIARTIVSELAEKKGIHLEGRAPMDYNRFKEQQYNQLADTLREHLDLEQIYRIINREESL